MGLGNAMVLVTLMKKEEPCCSFVQIRPSILEPVFNIVGNAISMRKQWS